MDLKEISRGTVLIIVVQMSLLTSASKIVEFHPTPTPTPDNLPILWLIGGNSPNAGFLTVVYEERLGTICDDGFELDEAIVACRHLGYTYGRFVAAETHHYSKLLNSLPILLDQLDCSGDEPSLWECDHDPWGKSDCSHDEDAFVVCSDEEPSPTEPAADFDFAYNGIEYAASLVSVDGYLAPAICTKLGIRYQLAQLSQSEASAITQYLDKLERPGYPEYWVSGGGDNCNIITKWGTRQYNSAVYLTNYTKPCDTCCKKVLCERMEGASMVLPSTSKPLGDFTHNKVIYSLTLSHVSGYKADQVCRDLGQDFQLAYIDAEIAEDITADINALERPGAPEYWVSGGGGWCNIITKWANDDYNSPVFLTNYSKPCDECCRKVACEKHILPSATTTPTYNLTSGDFIHEGVEYSVSHMYIHGSQANHVCELMGGGFKLSYISSATAETLTPLIDSLSRHGVPEYWVAGEGDACHIITKWRRGGYNSKVYRTNITKPCQDCCRKVVCERRVEHAVLPTQLLMLPSKLSNSGRLMVVHEGKHGTICADNFGIEDGKVACRQLGLPENPNITKTGRNYSPGIPDSTLILMDEVECTGREKTLWECGFSGWGQHNCMHHEDVVLTCSEPSQPTEGPDEHYYSPLHAELVGGKSPDRGILVVTYNRQRGVVCDDNFGAEEAKVACRQMGYEGPAQTTSTQYTDAVSRPENIDFIAMDDVSCTGREWSLLNCSFPGWGKHDCGENEDVVIHCENDDHIYPEGRVRLVDGSDQRSGRVEIFHDGMWGSVCDDRWDDVNAQVVCSSLGYRNGTAVREAYFGPGWGPIWMSEVACTGTEVSLVECVHSEFPNHVCHHSEDAGVICN